MKATAQLRAFYRKAERRLKAQLTGYREMYGRTSPCEGCQGHRCCSQQIQATPLEAMNIVEFINKMELDVDEALEQWLETYLSWPLSVQSQESAHFFKGLVCPFYVDKRCIIYKARPIVCRSYFSLEDDEQPCEGANEGNVTLLDNTKYLLFVGTGTQYYVMPLMVAVLLWQGRKKDDLVKRCDKALIVIRNAWMQRITERANRGVPDGQR